MQYTLRNIPSHVDAALRQKALTQARSLNEVAIEAIEQGLGLTGEPIPRRDLSDLAGTWLEDADCDAALDDQRRIDPGAWE